MVIRALKHARTAIAIGVALVCFLSQSAAHAFVFARPGASYQVASDDRGGTDTDDCALLNVCGAWFDAAGREIQAGVLIGANFNFGVVSGESDKNASAWVDSRFTVASGENRSVRAQVSGRVEWLGILFGGGVGKAKPTVKIEARLYDETAKNHVQGVVVHENTCQDLILFSACSFTDTGSKPMTLQADVIRGHTYRIRLEVTCNANAGILGIDVGCIYMENDLGDLGVDGYVKHSIYTLTIGDDIVELVRNLAGAVEKLEKRVDAIARSTDAIKSRQLEEIRLQHTPNGKRATDVPACGDAPCRWPARSGWPRE